MMSSEIKRRQMGDEMSPHKEIGTSRDLEVMKRLSVCRELKPSDTDGAAFQGGERNQCWGRGGSSSRALLCGRLRNLALTLHGILEVGERHD